MKSNFGNTSLDFLYNIGSEYALQEDYDKAIHYFKKVLEESPRHVNTLCNLGTVYALKNHYSDAINYLLYALGDQNDTIIFNNLGYCYYMMGNKKVAEDYWKKCINYQPNYGIPIQNLTLGFKN